MEEKSEKELSKLNMYEVICADALNQLQSNSPNQLSEFEKNQIIALLKRMFNAEKEFLIEEPDDYFEIYNDTNS